MVAELTVLDKVFEIITSSPSPDRILKMKADEEDTLRYEQLVSRLKDNQLTKEEEKELDLFILAERYMRLAKAKALLVR